MNQESPIDAKFWRILSRVLGRPVLPGHYRVADLSEWDSLRHVELVFELEESFGVSIPPETIADLFSDTDAVLVYLRANASC
jgi:acyl carrier protein